MNATKKTSIVSAGSARNTSVEKSGSKNSSSRIANKLARSLAFWSAWFRRPALDVAESTIRLRRLRHMSQAELARRLGTKQPAVARIESGRGNPTLLTVVQIAEALDATIRVEMAPVEVLFVRPKPVSWWEPIAATTPVLSQTLNIVQINVIGAGAAPNAVARMIEHASPKGIEGSFIQIEPDEPARLPAIAGS